MTLRRKHMPLSVKLAAALIAAGYDPAASIAAAGLNPREYGLKPPDDDEKIEWHHTPALEFRDKVWLDDPMREEAVDAPPTYLVPDENDPLHIIPMTKPDHRKQTGKREGSATIAGSDSHMKGKIDRLRAGRSTLPGGKTITEFTKDLMRLPTRKIQSRPFPKQKRKFRNG